MKKCLSCKRLRKNSFFNRDNKKCNLCIGKNSISYWSHYGVRLFKGIKDYKFWKK